MSNSYFQFKQFTVYQDKCAMKVCTDACVFGAFASNIVRRTSNIVHILDIGTGTGLLSLLLAQDTTAFIDAIEIDRNAYEQAKDNFDRSPWKERLAAFNIDALKFIADKKYDCIISNPPFFEDDLRSINEEKNKAKHDSSLTLQQLLQVVDSNLSDDGTFFVLLPHHRVHYFETEAKKIGLYPDEKLWIKQTEKHDYFRACLSFSRKETKSHIVDLTIKNNDGNYTDKFIELLKRYYLHF
ncbi:MAG TPA: methyltransferase [Ferruginibacter sp.]|nr:methyltransferase [Ferruginibacter sp.]